MSESYDDSSSGFALRSKVGLGNGDWSEVQNDGFDDEPSVESDFASYGRYQLVGHGKMTNEWCGKYRGYMGCLRGDLHGVRRLDGEDYSGKAYIRIVHHFCDKPSCPICFKHGWAVRASFKIEGRLAEASKRFGLVEHIVCSIPVVDYGLSYEDLRKKALDILFGLGVVGGVLIFHGFRYDKHRGWFWSPHFHVLGFIVGGYGRCRHCTGGNCYKCDGFDGKTYRLYRENGYIVKVLGERITVGGTAWYQLNHSTIRVDVRRPHVATWFGVCSYRKLKVSVGLKKLLCPICSELLVRVFRSGALRVVKDRNASDYVGSFVDDLVDADGRPNWVEASGGGYG